MEVHWKRRRRNGEGWRTKTIYKKKQKKTKTKCDGSPLDEKEAEWRRIDQGWSVLYMHTCIHAYTYLHAYVMYT
jgi:hypothetical protein